MTEAISRPRFLSSPDSDPSELKRQIRERDAEEKRALVARVDKHDDAIQEIKKTLGEFKAMIRAWLFAASLFWALIVLLAGFAMKFWVR